jgi:FixJ family two-component response regulator
VDPGVKFGLEGVAHDFNNMLCAIIGNAEALRELKPNLPVIITSGFSITGITQELLNNDRVQFLPKPFLREELLHAIGMVLQL